jgi:hypothetical protein
MRHGLTLKKSCPVTAEAIADLVPNMEKDFDTAKADFEGATTLVLFHNVLPFCILLPLALAMIGIDGKKRAQCLKYVFTLSYVVLLYNFIAFFAIVTGFTTVTGNLAELSASADTGLANIPKCVSWTGKPSTYKT